MQEIFAEPSENYRREVFELIRTFSSLVLLTLLKFFIMSRSVQKSMFDLYWGLVEFLKLFEGFTLIMGGHPSAGFQYL